MGFSSIKVPSGSTTELLPENLRAFYTQQVIWEIQNHGLDENYTFHAYNAYDKALYDYAATEKLPEGWVTPDDNSITITNLAADGKLNLNQVTDSSSDYAGKYTATLQLSRGTDSLKLTKIPTGVKLYYQKTVDYAPKQVEVTKNGYAPGNKGTFTVVSDSKIQLGESEIAFSYLKSDNEHLDMGNLGLLITDKKGDNGNGYQSMLGYKMVQSQSTVTAKLDSVKTPQNEVLKTDEDGTPLAGVTFKLYKAKDEGDQYVCGTEGSTHECGTDPNDDVPADKTTTGLIGSAESGENGKLQFADASGNSLSLKQLRDQYGDYFVVREVAAKAGYRNAGNIYVRIGTTGSGYTYAYSENYLNTGAYISTQWRVEPDQQITYCKNNETCDPANADNMSKISQSELAKGNGKLFAIITKRTGSSGGEAGFYNPNNWTSVTGNSTDGWELASQSGIAGTVEVVNAGNVIEFKQNEGAASGETQYEVTINDLPGNINDYFHMKSDKDKLSAKWTIAYFYSEQNDLTNADTTNTHRVLSDDFVRDYNGDSSMTLKVPNLKHSVQIQKLDSDGKVLKAESHPTEFTAYASTTDATGKAVPDLTKPLGTAQTKDGVTISPGVVADGVATFPAEGGQAFENGTYFGLETKAPARYQKNPNYIKVVIDDSGPHIDATGYTAAGDRVTDVSGGESNADGISVSTGVTSVVKNMAQFAQSELDGPLNKVKATLQTSAEAPQAANAWQWADTADTSQSPLTLTYKKYGGESSKREYRVDPTPSEGLSVDTTTRTVEDGYSQLKVTPDGRDSEDASKLYKYNRLVRVQDKKFGEVRVDLQVKKSFNVTGTTAAPDTQATFRLTRAPGSETAPMPTNAIDGSATIEMTMPGGPKPETHEARFAPILYTEPGVYKYVIQEDTGTASGVSYSLAVWTATVTVEEEDDPLTPEADLKATVVYTQNNKDDGTPMDAAQPTNEASFVNTYDVDDVSVSIKGRKAYTDTTSSDNTDGAHPMTPGEFKVAVWPDWEGGNPGTDAPLADNTGLRLTDNDGSVTGRVGCPYVLVSNDENSMFTFPSVTFNSLKHGGKSYKYVFKEIIPAGAVTHDGGKTYTLNGITYDGQQKTVTATMSGDPESGHVVKLESDDFVDGENNMIEFTNSYAAQTTANLAASKNLTGRAWGEGETFTFTQKAADKATEKAIADGVVTMPGDSTATATGPANCTVSGTGADSSTVCDVNFSQMTFTKVGTYTFDINEKVPDDANKLPGVSYDKHTLKAVVKVTAARDPNNGTLTGQLNADVTYKNVDKGSKTFTNVYKPESVAAKLNATKKLQNKADVAQKVKADAFTFKVTRTSPADAPMPARVALSADGNSGTATNAAGDDQTGGAVDFGSITFAKAGTYEYTVAEVVPNPVTPGMTYDKTVYTVKYEVTDTDTHGVSTGKLRVANTTITSSAQTGGQGQTQNAIVFTNTYEKPAAPATLEGTKKLTGGDIKDWGGKFTFTIEDKSDSTLPSSIVTGTSGSETLGEKGTSTNDASGKFAFNLTYSAIGSYSYTITEKSDPLFFGVRYDKSTYAVTVNVWQEGNKLVVGKPSYTKTDENGTATQPNSVVFTNVVAGVSALPLTGERSGLIWLAAIGGAGLLAILFWAGTSLNRKRRDE
jgi:pilin isopeptide linkage protein